MSNILELELGGAFLVVWVLSLIAMYLLIDRKTRPGRIRSVAVIEGMMLVSILSLLIGLTFTIWGSGVTD
ncbi:MAG: hypothetical protein J0I57_07750 [Hyphomicrobium sp.]|jgi:hypothetical protein|uniref:hypothetical protein n=1 Tax=Hyphomicrobium sp. CS1BSMeth3 TaxID=1892844 RepID=UPI00086F0AD5|nr:hypothetical protein [Hyphomicrobium sp. CS1BSMeth3]MBN9261357.1 hypothetical protein [Hyphomicrobium sp.]ODT26917.1 MAG: hypothetical protein ABS54_06610 [Hyphomicrobium sp. SCN 65-11]OJU22776.1 MAG: hypothetical protein BGN89_03520 [Alphaproteobacteria bacterium 64-6]MBN9265818.1 hypothetical protein [Hyphomicrobium sp.]MBN9277514.1 hypothetical protein [Hyphomicrobium sp.]